MKQDVASFLTTRRRFLGTSAALLGGLTLGCASTNAQNTPAPVANNTGKKPLNIVLVNTDDQGVQMGAYGDPLARTPNLDALAARSVLFENGYVTQASCSPSRSSFLTGLYPHQNGQIGLANLGYRMDEGVVNLPQLLHDAGYYNVILGKLHVNPESAFPFDFAQKDGKKTWDVRGLAQTVGEQIKAAGDKPFFFYVNYLDPHTPFQDSYQGIPETPQTPAQMKPFPFVPVPADELNPGVREQMAGYYNGIARADAGIGLLLDELKKSGHENDTLIIFIGDHGAPFTRAKNSTYEAGLKVPFIVHWPGQTQGHRDARLVSTIDIMPTILDAAQVKAPQGLPGASMRPLMAGGQTPWRTTLSAENNAHGSESWFPQRTIRDARFKLIYTINPGKNPKPVGDGGKPWLNLVKEQATKDGTLAGEVFSRQLEIPQWQFYDLQSDPWEFHNLAGEPQFAADEKRLKAELTRWRVETRDPLLDPQYLAAINAAHAASDKPRFDDKKWDETKPAVQIPTLEKALRM